MHCATDWEPYAEQMLDVLTAHPAFENTQPDGGFAPRPAFRPLTRFEGQGLDKGHVVRDLLFRRVAAPTPSPRYVPTADVDTGVGPLATAAGSPRRSARPASRRTSRSRWPPQLDDSWAAVPGAASGVTGRAAPAVWRAALRAGALPCSRSAA